MILTNLIYIGSLLDRSVYLKTNFSDYPTKTSVVGTQKNRLNETVLLSTLNIL